MVDLNIEVEGLAALSDLVPSSKLSSATQRAVDYMVSETQGNFASESDPDGNAWASLAASTVKSKGHDQILRKTSTLQGSISGRRLSPTSGQVMSGAAHAAFSQLGTANQPQRQFMGFGDRHVQRIKQFYAEALAD